VFSMVALTALTTLPTVLALTLFIAVLMTVSRSYRDSEMVCGSPPGRACSPGSGRLLRFAAPMVLLIAVLALLITPWAGQQLEESKQRFRQRDDVSRVAPGRFIESSGAQRCSSSSRSTCRAPRSATCSSATAARPRGVIVAREGVIEARPNGDRYLVLLNGRRYEGRRASCSTGCSSSTATRSASTSGRTRRCRAERTRQADPAAAARADTVSPRRAAVAPRLPWWRCCWH